MTAEIPVHVAGARGLLAGEFLRLLVAHPTLRLAAAYSRGGSGTIADSHPHLRGVAAGAEALRPHEALAGDLARSLASGPAALLLAMNHGESAGAWEALREQLGEAAANLTVVDLSADYRLPGEHGGENWYYGLPELHPVPQGARRIASAGCFATAMQLAIVPAVREYLIDLKQPIFVHGITGSSGSGAQPKPGTHHPHRHDNLWAYAWSGHRHEAEVVAARNFPDGAPPLHFTACSGPFSRGIYLEATLRLRPGIDVLVGMGDRVKGGPPPYPNYLSAFHSTPCVRLLKDGPPQLRGVLGSNSAEVFAGARDGYLHVFVALDNITKGGAGQGLQCLNLAFGLPETAGLPLCGLGC